MSQRSAWKTTLAFARVLITRSKKTTDGAVMETGLPRWNRLPIAKCNKESRSIVERDRMVIVRLTVT